MIDNPRVETGQSSGEKGNWLYIIPSVWKPSSMATPDNKRQDQQRGLWLSMQQNICIVYIVSIPQLGACSSGKNNNNNNNNNNDNYNNSRSHISQWQQQQQQQLQQPQLQWQQPVAATAVATTRVQGGSSRSRDSWDSGPSMGSGSTAQVRTSRNCIAVYSTPLLRETTCYL